VAGTEEELAQGAVLGATTTEEALSDTGDTVAVTTLLGVLLLSTALGLIVVRTR
jgi:hypothetical protein